MKGYQLGRIGFDPDASELFSDVTQEHLQPQVRDVLLCLINHAGHVVTRQQLVSESWGNRPVTDECLTRCVSVLQSHLRQHGEPHLIEILPSKGYRLTANSVMSRLDTAESPAVNLNDTVRQSLFIRFDASVLKAVTGVLLLGLLLVFVAISVG